MSILQIKKVFSKAESKPKKVAVKAVTKKTKKTSTGTKASQKIGLVCAEGDRCFWSNDGLIFANLADLRDALSDMSDEVYAHHVTPERNDFADWVEFVLLDKTCANGLRKAKGKKAAAAVVIKSLSLYVV